MIIYEWQIYITSCTILASLSNLEIISSLPTSTLEVFLKLEHIPILPFIQPKLTLNQIQYDQYLCH